MPVKDDIFEAGKQQFILCLRQCRLQARGSLSVRSSVTNLVNRYFENEQEVWPPGSADTVSPRRPLMTQVQHWASRLKQIT